MQPQLRSADMRPPRVHHRPVCALCGVRDANTPDEIDGATVVVCFSCKTPPKKPLVSDPWRIEQQAHRDYVLRTLARMEGPMELADLAEVLDVNTVSGRGRLSKLLQHAASTGLVAIGWTSKRRSNRNRTYAIRRKR